MPGRPESVDGSSVTLVGAGRGRVDDHAVGRRRAAGVAHVVGLDRLIHVLIDRLRIQLTRRGVDDAVDGGVGNRAGTVVGVGDLHEAVVAVGGGEVRRRVSLRVHDRERSDDAVGLSGALQGHGGVFAARRTGRHADAVDVEDRGVRGRAVVEVGVLVGVGRTRVGRRVEDDLRRRGGRGRSDIDDDPRAGRAEVAGQVGFGVGVEIEPVGDGAITGVGVGDLPVPQAAASSLGLGVDEHRRPARGERALGVDRAGRAVQVDDVVRLDVRDVEQRRIVVRIVVVGDLIVVE